MSVNNKAVKSLSGKDTYIMLMSPEERQKAITDKKITQEDVDSLNLKSLLLTPQEKDQLFATMTFAALLFIVAKSSLGKSEVDLNGLQKKLKKLNDWIGKLNNAVAYANTLNTKKDEKDKKFFIDAPELKGLKEILKDIKKEFGSDKIKTADFFQWEPTSVKGISELKSLTPNIAVEQLQNISRTLDNEVKTASTKVSKANNDHNTFLETLSFLAKKFTDTIQALLQRM